MTTGSQRAIKIRSSGAGSPVSFLWPRESDPDLPMALVGDDRIVQTDVLGGNYHRVSMRAKADNETVVLRTGSPNCPPDPIEADLFLPFRVRLIADDGADLYAGNYESPDVDLTANGPLLQLGHAINANVALFTKWYPDLGAGEARIVVRNGTIDELGVFECRDLHGRLEISYGGRVLYSQRVVHHFGRMASWRFAVTRDDAGEPAVSLQMAPWPDSWVGLPLPLYAEMGLLPGYHSSVKASAEAAHAADWGDTDFEKSILWVEGGASGGGKPQLAPLPQWDVFALHDHRHLPSALHAADTMPYQFFFTTPEGAPVTPSTHPRGWVNQSKYPDGRAINADNPHIKVGEMERARYTTNAAHLPSPFIVPAIMTGDPFYAWAAKEMAHGVAMGSRGVAGNIIKRGTDNTLVGVPGANTVNSRGPTGAEGHLGGEHRGNGWGMSQRLDAITLTGDPLLMELARTNLVIARGQYLDEDHTTLDHNAKPLRHWGAFVQPFRQDAVWRDGHGLPQSEILHQGSDDRGYARPNNAINTDNCTHAHAQWQGAFNEMAYGKAERLFRGIPGLEWLRDLLVYAVQQRLEMLDAGLPVSEYCWPIRNDAGWIELYDESRAGWLHPEDDIPPRGRSVQLDANGLCHRNGYAYVGYGGVGMVAAKSVDPAAYTEWMALLESSGVMELIDPEWRIV